MKVANVELAHHISQLWISWTSAQSECV